MLDELADAVRDRPGARTDDEQMWLTRFLVVRSCGYLEQVMYLCATNHLEAKSAGTARSYSLSWLERSINPSVLNISVTLGRFDQGLANEFELNAIRKTTANCRTILARWSPSATQ
ncbi:hypothetical protein JS562_53610 [Agrobacterium sp. S2]|nr:hypothetical protein [Agrobacterium sp. S2]